MHRITRKKSTIISAFVTCFLSAFFLRAGAQVTINGMVTDKDQLPVPTANVLLLNFSDSSMVKGGVTDGSGRFQFQRIMPGSYLLSVSMVGFQKHISTPFHADQKKLQLDTILLQVSVEQMEGVTVTARRPLFEQQIDRLVVNVQRSITSSGGTVLEVLEKSPGIQINRQSNSISMNGKTGVMVMLNDKMLRLPIDAVLQMLDGMNAADIDQIELITTPPAKYEAEGDAGIINIKTKEHADLGYNGSVG